MAGETPAWGSADPADRHATLTEAGDRDADLRVEGKAAFRQGHGTPMASMIISFAAGVIAAGGLAVAGMVHWPADSEAWAIASVAAAALCLGFGIATFWSMQARRAGSDDLRAELADTRARAFRLLEELDRFDRRAAGERRTTSGA